MELLRALLVVGITLSLLPSICALHDYKMIFGRPMHGFVFQQYTVEEVKEMMGSGKLVGMSSGFYDQTLNHNAVAGDADFGKTFKQKFYVNDAYYTAGGPEFLYIGGEGPESGHALVNSDETKLAPMMVWAKALNARGWVLEHRFYGESRPFEQQTTKALKYLHSEQALADLAAFIDAKKVELNIPASKWIVFGGSYPGALALWFRERYPDSTVGAVGSSAPVEPRLDFSDYLKVCQNSYNDVTWGSTDCANSIKSAFNAVTQLMDYQGGRDYLDTIFSLYPKLSKQNLTDQNVANFYSNLIGYFQGAVQYNRVNGGVYRTNGSIPEICSQIQTTSYSLTSGLVNVVHFFTEVYGTTFDKIFDSYDSMITLLKDPNYYGNGRAAAARSWTWQTCNEFGYFQSTDFGYNIFGDTVPNSFYINMCTDIFGPEYGYDYVKNAVKDTLKRYHGRKGYNGTNVVACNGAIDPWSALGLRLNDSPDQVTKKVVAHLIPGTAHCADMGPPLPTDSADLVAARTLIFNSIKDWLGITTTRPKRSLDESTNDEKQGVQLDSKLEKEELHKNSEINPEFQDRSEFSQKQEKQQLDDTTLYTEVAYQQPVNHADPDGAKFNLITYQITKFVKTPATDPMIIFVLLDDVVDTYASSELSPILAIAKDLNASVWFVQARYFGKSKVYADLQTASLNNLNIDQILKDINAIISLQPAAIKKIVVGSQLGGTIAALYRKKYTNAIGALASSAPLDFQLTAPDGLEAIEASFSDYNTDCYNGLSDVYSLVHNLLLTREGRKKLVDAQIACSDGFPDANHLDPMNKAVFKYRALDRVLTVAGFAGESAIPGMDHYITLDSYCGLMSDKTIDAFQKLNATVAKPCISTDYTNKFLAPYKVTGYTEIPINNQRVKLFLQCKEVGFLMNTDYGRSVFSNLVTPNFFINICYDVFGFTHTDLLNNIVSTRNNYGGVDDYKASNVIFTYGTFDINSPLTFHGDSGDQGQERIQLLIPNAGISNDLIGNAGTEEAKDVRGQIATQFKRWLQ